RRRANSPSPSATLRRRIVDAGGTGTSARSSTRSIGSDTNTGPVGELAASWNARSEEHTSELQSQSNLVCRLLLEKKKHHPRQNRRQRPRARALQDLEPPDLLPRHLAPRYAPPHDPLPALFHLPPSPTFPPSRLAR